MFLFCPFYGKISEKKEVFCVRKTVCLIGRPNTGKSTLFNRLINEKKAIIDDMPGVTRDRIYGIVNYKDNSFNLIDTGGIDLAK